MIKLKFPDPRNADAALRPARCCLRPARASILQDSFYGNLNKFGLTQFHDMITLKFLDPRNADTALRPARCCLRPARASTMQDSFYEVSVHGVRSYSFCSYSIMSMVLCTLRQTIAPHQCQIMFTSSCHGTNLGEFVDDSNRWTKMIMWWTWNYLTREMQTRLFGLRAVVRGLPAQENCVTISNGT